MCFLPFLQLEHWAWLFLDIGMENYPKDPVNDHTQNLVECKVSTWNRTLVLVLLPVCVLPSFHCLLTNFKIQSNFFSVKGLF